MAGRSLLGGGFDAQKILEGCLEDRVGDRVDEGIVREHRLLAGVGYERGLDNDHRHPGFSQKRKRPSVGTAITEPEGADQLVLCVVGEPVPVWGVVVAAGKVVR